MFGDETEAAVKKFQQHHHSDALDGVVRLLTWAKLLEIWAALPTHTFPLPASGGVRAAAVPPKVAPWSARPFSLCQLETQS